MKQWIKTKWKGILVIASFILSITSLIRCEPIVLTDSWLAWSIGISTSVISIAITAAIAIQVYNSIVSEAKIKRIIESKIKENKDAINKKSEDNRQEFLSFLYITQSQRYFIEGDYETALDILMRALTHAKECIERTAYNTTIEAIKLLINKIKEDNNNFSIEVFNQLWYKDLVSKINDKSIIEIEDFINKVNTKTSKIPENVKELLDPLKKENKSNHSK